VSAADFLDGVAAGRAEIVERPSSPQTLAHNLYSIAYQFYGTNWIWAAVPQEFLLRYVDRSLRCTGDEDGGLLSRLHFLWQYRRLRKIKGSIPGPLVDLLKRESTRLIAEEPDLFELPREGERISQRLEDRWFQFIDKMSAASCRGSPTPDRSFFGSQPLQHLSYHRLRRRLLHAAGALFRRLRPSQRAAQARPCGHGASASGRRIRYERHPCAIFADRLEEARDSALFAIDAARRAKATIITCEAADGPGVHRFAPIGPMSSRPARPPPRLPAGAGHARLLLQARHPPPASGQRGRPAWPAS